MCGELGKGPGAGRIAMENKSRTELFENLRRMLKDVLELRAQGVSYPKLARAHGYLDGYMRALLETGIFDQKELLSVITEQRNAHDGPATRSLTPEAASDATAA
jgi:hypothetical protein